MLTLNTKRGICAACAKDLECTYVRDFDAPPLECGEFELSIRAVEPPEPLDAPEIDPPREAKTHAGLCANCENRAACIYPRPEGGIWRCEEYL
jgi:hypothetical protein